MSIHNSTENFIIFLNILYLEEGASINTLSKKPLKNVNKVPNFKFIIIYLLTINKVFIGQITLLAKKILSYFIKRLHYAFSYQYFH